VWIFNSGDDKAAIGRDVVEIQNRTRERFPKPNSVVRQATHVERVALGHAEEHLSFLDRNAARPGRCRFGAAARCDPSAQSTIGMPGRWVKSTCFSSGEISICFMETPGTTTALAPESRSARHSSAGDSGEARRIR
jgi:hypothetical protein